MSTATIMKVKSLAKGIFFWLVNARNTDGAIVKSELKRHSYSE